MAQPTHSELISRIAQKDRRVAELEAQFVRLESRLASQDRRRIRPRAPSAHSPVYETHGVPQGGRPVNAT